MKRCSTCNRTYTDPNLSFCIDDGTPLTTVATDDETTVVKPRGNEDDEWNAVAYRPPTPPSPPSPYVSPGAQPQPRRRVWPWVVGIAGAFVLGLLAISIAALIMAPRLRARQDQRTVVPIHDPSNSNSVPANINANSNSSGNVNTPPPSNQEQVLAHLKNLENEWMVANVNADKKKLALILADDYVGQSGPEGGLETKAEYLKRTERDDQIQKWEMSEEKLTLTGDRATLAGIVTFFLRDGRVGSFDFKDKFVWRDGRWQATGSELTARKPPVGTNL